ncbi:MAG: BMP family protein [Lachnospirales bacterium]
MKKLLSIGIIATLAITATACSSNETPADTATSTETEGSTDSTSDSQSTDEAADVELYKVGMTTDSGTIDDKSFNQGTWEGIKRYEEEFGTIESRYVQPAGEAEQDYLDAYANLVDLGYKTIFSPGYKFETAVYKAQELYPDVNFVILDGYPHSGDYAADIASNTESIFFAEQESGFYAGVASAMSTNTGKVGFIGGSEIPAVQKFGWGYVAGIAYANENFGTDVSVSEYIYQGTFTDIAAGKSLAGQFYDNGCDIIFAAAGGVGVGVIDEGKTRRSNSEDVWVVGVDVDQYESGKMADGSSVILTSAMKDLNAASYNALDEILNGTFKGSEMITLDTSNGGVGLPEENPNLSEEALAKYEEVYASVLAGDIVVPSTVEDLEAFLSEHGYTTPSGVVY